MELSPNRLVAFNLQMARGQRNWTQQQAAEEVSKYLPKPWSRSTYSLAEGSVTGRRVRNFDADEIVAFALAFDLPIAWFFTPPAGTDERRWGPKGLPSQTSQRTSVRVGDAEFDFLQWLERVLPADVREWADEIRGRATLQVQLEAGVSDADRIRATWRVVRDHLIGWLRTLGTDPSISSPMREATDAIDLLLAMTGEQPPPQERPEWATDEFGERVARKHGLPWPPPDTGTDQEGDDR